MNERIHFIVARSRKGWSVNIDADRVSEHARPEDARAEAEAMAEQAERDGASARMVDLSDDEA